MQKHSHHTSWVKLKSSRPVAEGGYLLTCVPREPRVAADLVWVVLLMPDPFLNNDSAQETVPQGLDPPTPSPHLSSGFLAWSLFPSQNVC